MSGEMVDRKQSKDFAMWEEVSKILTNIMTRDGDSNSDTVLNMIRRDLTFDDPGFFPAGAIGAEEYKYTKACHFWLMQQLLAYLTYDKFNLLLPSNLELQSEILSASLVKQAMLFPVLLRKYVDVLREILQKSKEKEFEIKTIQTDAMKLLDLTTVHPLCVYEPIKVTSETIEDRLLDCCVDVITHGVSLIINANDELLVECSTVVLDALKQTRIPIKISCTTYFGVVLEHLEAYSESIKRVILSLLLSLKVVLREQGAWVRDGVADMNKIELLNRTMTYNFKQLKVQCLMDSEAHVTNVLDICVDLIKICSEDDKQLGRWLSPIVDFLFGYLEVLAEQKNRCLHRVDEVFDLIETEPVLVKLLKQPLIRQLLTDNSDQHVLWNRLIGVVDRHTVSMEQLASRKILLHIFDLIRVVNHALTMHETTELYPNEHLTNIRMRILMNRSYQETSIRHFMKFVDSLTLRTLTMKICEFILEMAYNYLTVFADPPQEELSAVLVAPFISKMGTNSVFENVPVSLREAFAASTDFEVAIRRSCELLLKVLPLAGQPRILDYVTAQSTDERLLEIVVRLHYLVGDFTEWTELAERGGVKLLQLFVVTLKEMLCITSPTTLILRAADRSYTIKCPQCDPEFFAAIDCTQLPGICGASVPAKHAGIVVTNHHNTNIVDWIANGPTLLLYFRHEDKKVRLQMIANFPAIITHTGHGAKNTEELNSWVTLFADTDVDVIDALATNIGQIMLAIQKKSYDPAQNETIVLTILQSVVKAIQAAVQRPNAPLQSAISKLVNHLAACDIVNEEYLAKCVNCQLHFLVCSNSEIAREASMWTIDMLRRRNVVPNSLFNWYKQYMLKLIVHLCVYNFLKGNVNFNSSMTIFSKTLGFSGPRDFIWKYYSLVSALLLPWCIRFPKAVALLKEMCELIQKPLAKILSTSFLTIYTYLSLNETEEVVEKCIDFLIENTSNDLYYHMQTNVQRTVAEILVFYNKNQEWVMRAFRQLLSKNQTDAKMSMSDVAEFISIRFLGVITFIESFITFVETERWLKVEALLSLGGIIRLLGSGRISKFRFKIIALLKTVTSVEETGRLRDACAKVWTIFIRNIDIECLGPLLSTVFVSLAALLSTHPDEVNAIFRYLVIENGNLLSFNIPDLFFLEKWTNYNIDEAVLAKVRAACAQRTKPANFVAELEELVNFVKNENAVVRSYGIKQMRQAFRTNRKELNNLIFAQNAIDPIVSTLLDTLLVGCKNNDQNLRLAAGECIGELGAIEPSLFPPNYAPQDNFSLSAHTDSFAQIALVELCRAYQFQKDSKIVDCFSLAIQQILRDRGVDPKSNRKMEVWQAIPEQMRQLMEPLLTSNYTNLGCIMTTPVHPVFGSKAQTCLEWAATWAINIVEFVKDEVTYELLKSLLPSMRHDMNTLTLFLPFVILHTLQGSGDTACNQRIYEELKFLFEKVVAAHQSQGSDILDRPATMEAAEGSRLRAIKTLNFVESTQLLSQTYHEMEDKGVKCAKLAFCQLDFVEKWVRQWRRVSPTTNRQNSSNCAVVEAFLANFDKKFLAQANFYCEEYSRALIYLEEYIMAAPMDRLQPELPLLAQIYAQLRDADSLEGAMCVKTVEPTLEELITVYNITGRLHESAACFERMMQLERISAAHMNELVQCYLGLGQPETALLVAESLMGQLCEDTMGYQLQETKAEPLWRLGRFEELEQLFHNNEISAESKNWGVMCGKLLLDFRQNDAAQFSKQLQATRLSVLKQFCQTEMLDESAYQIDHPNVMKLHLITEFESAFQLVEAVRKPPGDENRTGQELVKEFLADWDARLELIQPWASVMEPVISLRRIILGEARHLLATHFEQSGKQSGNSVRQLLDMEISRMWMLSTDYASKANNFEQAHLYILNAEEYKPQELFLEKAKLFWNKGDQQSAFKVLEKGMAKILEAGQGVELKRMPRSLRKIYAEGKLLVAMYNAEKVNIGTELNLKYFKESVQAFSESEKSLVQLAAYLDRIYAAMPEAEQTQRGGQILLEIVTYYGKSMEYGCHFVYQSMPRLLSVWFDYSSTPVLKRDENYAKVVGAMNKTIEKFNQTLPTFMFYTAFSQLVSRICHPSKDVYNVLRTIIIQLIKTYPQHCLWNIMSVCKSTFNFRKARCQDILSDPRLADPAFQFLLRNVNSLVESLVVLTNREISRECTKPTVSSLAPDLVRLLRNKNFSKIIVPTEHQIQLMLPPISDRDKPVKSFDPFPNTSVYIHSIREEVVIMLSLQRPRRVNFLGSDGKEYTVLCKPKDDLRKDYRLMEFNAVVKQYLYQDPEARHRRLKIRTYQVMPLNEECGIIEWVNNVTTFRSILNVLYKRGAGLMARKDLMAASCKPHDPIELKRDKFTNTLLKHHPPVFSEWFRECFSNPHNWYQARSSYIKTTAVMSMVGYILGLGDRHSENILFDGTNGEVVHVDFNCLFNRGESFDYPEVVPFRLTHNMVSAMGPLGVEGPFRKCCEITLRVLQSQAASLGSILRPFVYDPLVSWSTKGPKTDTNGERTDPQALSNTQHIEQRLKGYVKMNGKLSSLPLSTKGQVNFLISEATGLDNLASMYIGWGAFF